MTANDAALLSEPSTMAALGTAISAAETVAELESVLQRIYRWTEGELPLREPALRSLIEKANYFSEIRDRSQVLLWVAAVGCSDAEVMLASPSRAAYCVDPQVAETLADLGPTVAGLLKVETPPLCCAACAVLMRAKPDRETITSILRGAQAAKSDDVIAGIALLLGHALRWKACDAEQAEIAREFLQEAKASPCLSVRCIAVVAEALDASQLDEAACVILCDSLTVPARVEGVVGFGPHGREILSTARYAAMILRWVSVPDRAVPRIVDALLRWSGGDVTSEALRHVAFGDTVVPPSGLTRESLTAEQVNALRHIAHHGSEALLASLGFGADASDVDEFLSGEAMPWRPIVMVPDRNVAWHYVKVARAVADDEISASVGVTSWLDVVDDLQEALMCCLNDYWFLADLSSGAWERHQGFVLMAVDALSRRGLPIVDQLEQAANDGSPANSGLLAAALAQSYASSGFPWPTALDEFLSEALGVAKVGQPLRRVLEQLPSHRLESVLATYPALPFWDMCLTVPVVSEMVEFARLFPEHEQDVLDCFLRGNVRKARESLSALRSKNKELVERLLANI